MFQHPAKRKTMIEQKTDTGECNRYIYSMNGQQIQPVRRAVVSAKGLVLVLKDKKNASGPLVALGLCGTFCCS
jgi:hypothetical protein